MSEEQEPKVSDPSLPRDGRSVHERRNSLIWRKELEPAAVAMLMVLIAAFEGLSWYLHWPRQPWVYVGLAVSACVFALHRYRKVKREVAVISRGHEGALQTVGYLEALRDDGFHVYHDIPGDPTRGESFNIDHLLIGPKGIFVVESKLPSTSPKERVEYDGENLLVNGFLDKESLKTVKHRAVWVRKLMREQCDLDLPVRGIVVFPGWWVTVTVSNPLTFVLNPKSVQVTLDNLTDILARGTLATARSGIERYLRQIQHLRVS